MLDSEISGKSTVLATPSYPLLSVPFDMSFSISVFLVVQLSFRSLLKESTDLVCQLGTAAISLLIARQCCRVTAFALLIILDQHGERLTLGSKNLHSSRSRIPGILASDSRMPSSSWAHVHVFLLVGQL
jgi:hypothetical protein